MVVKVICGEAGGMAVSSLLIYGALACMNDYVLRTRCIVSVSNLHKESVHSYVVPLSDEMFQKPTRFQNKRSRLSATLLMVVPISNLQICKSIVDVRCCWIFDIQRSIN
jgi:hypothetical protein